MEIDVFTFVAQVFNFALLVYLLKRFLYGPILRAMDAREQHIAERLAEADDEQQQAEKLAEEYRSRLSEHTRRSDEMIAEARAEADRLALKLNEELRARMNVREIEWAESQKRQAEQELREFRVGVSAEILATLRAAMSDFADATLEERMTETFLRRIDGLSDEQVRRLIGDDEDRRPALQIVTSFVVADDARPRIEERVRARMGADTKLSFEEDPDGIAGIELRCHGHRLGWNLADYLESLDRGVRARLDTLSSSSGMGTHDSQPSA